MANDYDKMDASDITRVLTPPPGLRSEEFLSIVRDKSPDWLEMAASIIQITDDNPRIMPRHMYSFKCFHTPEFIDSVYGDLYDLNLMRVRQVC